MRTLLGSFGLVALFCLAIACGADDSDQDTAGQTAEDTMNLALSFDPAEPTVGQNKLMVDLTDAEGQPVVGATVSVDPQMPHHGHGSTETPEVSEEGGGKYAAFPVTFQMPGMWEVTVTATSGETTGNKKLTVTVQ